MTWQPVTDNYNLAKIPFTCWSVPQVNENSVQENFLPFLFINILISLCETNSYAELQTQSTAWKMRSTVRNWKLASQEEIYSIWALYRGGHYRETQDNNHIFQR
jgi:hypothetical protein